MEKQTKTNEKPRIKSSTKEQPVRIVQPCTSFVL